MPKKNIKKTKRTNTRKNKRKSKKNMRKMSKRGGDCGCSGNSKLSYLGGGYLNPATYNGQMIPGSDSIPLNSYNVAGSSVIDPIDANHNMSTRNNSDFSFMGGKRRTRKEKISKMLTNSDIPVIVHRGKGVKKSKKTKGGGMLSDFFLGPNTGNLVHSFGNLNGVADMQNILSSNRQINPNIWEQPINSIKGQYNYNPPLV